MLAVTARAAALRSRRAGREQRGNRVAGILKFLGSAIGIIFLIGLVVVIGLFMLIF